jgi:membrane protease YdiL (CAAX protease family)
MPAHDEASALHVGVSDGGSSSDPTLRSLLLPSHNPLRGLRWRVSDLLVAIALLLAWRIGAALLIQDPERIPAAVRVLVGAALPFVLVTGFPIWAYVRAGGKLPPRVLPKHRVVLEAGLAVPVVFALLLALIIVGVLWQAVSGEEPGMAEPMRQVAFSNNPLLLAALAVGACLWAPIAEEMFFRGFLQNAMARRLPVWLAAVIQIALFTLAHAYTGLHLALIALVGAVVTLHYLWRRTLAASMFVHAGFNSIITLMLLMTMIAASKAPVLGVVLEDDPHGCRVVEVVEGYAADQAGIHSGDEIISLDGAPIDSPGDLQEQLLARQPGDKVTVAIRRGGDTLNLSATLSPRPESPAAEPAHDNVPE